MKYEVEVVVAWLGLACGAHFLRERFPSPTPDAAQFPPALLHPLSTLLLNTTMPNTNIQTGQDWGTVNVGRASAGRVSVPKTAHGVTRAKAMGLVATVSQLIENILSFFSFDFVDILPRQHWTCSYRQLPHFVLGYCMRCSCHFRRSCTVSWRKSRG